MRVSVIGCGHLGAPHAAAMAELGVFGVPIQPSKQENARPAFPAWRP